MITACALAQQNGIVRAIDVKGNKEVSTQAILAVMRTKVGQPYLQSSLDSDRRALEDLGFFQSVDVRGTAVENDNWDVVVNVSEFPVVREFSIVGNSVFTDEEILKLVSLEKDNPHLDQRGHDQEHLGPGQFANPNRGYREDDTLQTRRDV
jgi:outer membrane protein assembly factor BamA